MILINSRESQTVFREVKEGPCKKIPLLYKNGNLNVKKIKNVKVFM
jgi:hypothetical protein